MEQNPIRYQDLISPDDSITELISQLEKLQSSYEATAESIKNRAATISQSLKTVSGATQQGQQFARQAAAETNKLTKAYDDLNFARTNTAKKIMELNMAKKEENRITKLNIILNNTEEGSYAHLSAQYALNKIQLNQLTEAERQNLPHAKKLEEETKNIYERMKKLQEATGKYSLDVGNYENAITRAIGVNTQWYNGLKQVGALFEGGMAEGLKNCGALVGSFGKQLLALMANPIVLTIAAVTAAFAALAKGISSSEENTNTLNRVLAPFKRILEGVLNVLQEVAGFVLKVVEGFENLAMGASKLMERLPLVGNAIKSVNNALEKNIELEKEKQALQRDNRKLTKEEAKTQYEISVLRRKAAQTDDPAERAKLLNKAVRKEHEISNNRIAYTKRELAVLKERAKQSQNDSKLNDEIAQKEAELWNLRTQAEQRSLRMVRQIATAEKQLGKGDKSTPKGGTSTDVDAAKQELEELRKIEDAKIALVEDSYLRERMTIVSNYQRKIEDLKGSEEYITQMTELLYQQRDMKLADLAEKQAQDEAAREKKDYEDRIRIADEMIKKREAVVRAGEEEINRTYDFDMSAAELEQNENKKTELRLQAEKKRLEALLKLYENDGKLLTQKEVETIKNSIAAVNQEIEKNKGNKDIYDLLGFNLSDEKKEAIDTSLSYAMDGLSQFIDAYAEAADKKRQLADAEVERTQNVLQAELEARNKGYANEVDTARKELETAKKNQQKAIEQQKRAQKLQIALDTASQAANMITATSLIWKQLGFPWAIPAIAVMWGSFAAAKIKAVQAVSAGTEEYGEGTVELLEGGSHQSGHDIDLGTKSDGTKRRAEGGEFFAVINKRNSRKYRREIPAVIGALNNGTFAEKYLNAYAGGNINITADTPERDLTRLSDDVHSIKEQGERTTYFDGKGNTIVIYKNLKRIVKS